MDCTATITQTEYKLDFAPNVIFQPPHFDLKSKNNYESKNDRNEELRGGVLQSRTEKKRKKWGVDRGKSKKDSKREVHPSHCLNLTVTSACQPMRHLPSVQEIG